MTNNTICTTEHTQCGCCCWHH